MFGSGLARFGSCMPRAQAILRGAVSSSSQATAAYVARSFKLCPDETIDLLIMSSIDLGHAATFVAGALGVTRSILDASGGEFGQRLLGYTTDLIAAAIRDADARKLRLLLRLLAALSSSGVVSLRSLLGFLGGFVGKAIECAQANQGRDYRYWQPYADQLASLALLALPWAAAAVHRGGEAGRDAAAALLARADEYAALRKCTFSAACAPYTGERVGLHGPRAAFAGCSPGESVAVSPRLPFVAHAPTPRSIGLPSRRKQEESYPISFGFLSPCCPLCSGARRGAQRDQRLWRRLFPRRAAGGAKRVPGWRLGDRGAARPGGVQR